ncbi:ABC transporter ATP-binding protein [Bacillus sp. 3255]|uniref:ABC transporter ATP-binding protein n=1 Tax=Bacillus sp. 3255 TaxID=2817904 RepID=UPI00285F92F9|nr:ABC transporter ATP-binding protein [Bacillus sp. 3255]MDR6878744.1 teichoic acid transport system ATP-binding protein [Bacillus sp. 3255]
MLSDIAISVKNISKSFRMYPTPQHRLKQFFVGSRKQYFKEFRALNNVSFDVRKGETIGIIGKNGSGKSTILQIITGTLKPSSGEVNLNGKVSALLELGSGFNPEFTGRENAIMNGAIMGLSQAEMIERMPMIEDFAEIGEFIDQPVKTYSSGMFVRLAFACAVHVNPDILIVDEALAVGDMRFQLKCIDKMKSFKKEGKTILFVSHDSYSVRNFCDQAIWMMDGEIHLRGDVKAVTEQYQDYMKFESVREDVHLEQGTSNSVILTIDKVCFIDEAGLEQKSFRFGERVNVSVEYTLHTEMAGIVGGIALYDKQSNYICGLNTKLDSYQIPSNPGNYKLVLSYEQMNLLPGSYYVDIGFFESSAVVILDYKSRYDSFRIDSGEYFAEGIAYLPHQWKCEGL